MHIYHFLTRLGIIELTAPNILDAIELFNRVLPDLGYNAVIQRPNDYKISFAVEKVQLN